MKGWGPRTAGCGLIVVIGLVAIAHGDGPRTTAIGFDHLLHDRQVVVNGGESLACTRCHAAASGRITGRPDHATCFGACHGAAPVAPRRGARLDTSDADRMRLCTACHAESQLAAPYTGTMPVPYPPYTIDRDFNLAIGHRAHAAIACTECHAPPEAKTRPKPPHARCVGCHDGTRAPAMTRCNDCHPAASGRPQPPELRAIQDSVTATFSHGKHAARGPRGGDCSTCHAAVRATDDSELPRPTAHDCAAAGCHDGAAAFATAVACTRCHASAPDKFTVARPTARFTHGGPHADAVAKQPCGTCHPIDRGEVVVAGHAPCVGCHAADFGARTPKTCGACHNATEPWRHLIADRAPADRTELGATLDHGKHLIAVRASEGAKGDPEVGACSACHSLRTATQQLRPPRGHAACTTTGCHAVTGGPAPHLAECKGCHRLGLQAERENARVAAPWSVRTTFDHATHRTGRDGKEVACIACHVDLRAREFLALATPPKPTCAPCHDGTIAFKLTGTSCTKCHPGAPR
ncbi:MAG TPA: cytochrome c3 family protein [Kofleriaceae bacterium]|nr:cytochrome c3 family protein [Kofleriaceae bacterium]